MNKQDINIELIKKRIGNFLECEYNNKKLPENETAYSVNELLIDGHKICYIDILLLKDSDLTIVLKISEDMETEGGTDKYLSGMKTMEVYVVSSEFKMVDELKSFTSVECFDGEIYFSVSGSYFSDWNTDYDSFNIGHNTIVTVPAYEEIRFIPV